jgi:glycosyltransferase involved in cell wall biosynthesis
MWQYSEFREKIMRVGENPAKKIKKIPNPKRITVAVLSYVPFLSGYYRETLEVLRECLNGIWKNSDLPYDLMVFDNGSCKETREFLLDAQNRGKIQYLVLSEKNIGKGGAWNLIFQGAPGEIIAYCDSDALLFPGWLSACVQILETYPKVGMVTARPMRTNADLYSSTIQWAKKTREVKMEKGQLITFPEFKNFADTMGYSASKVKNLYESTQDYRFSYKGLAAFAGANHFQFVSWKKILNQFTPFEMDKPLGQVQQLDQKINNAGYLRLMTEKSLVQNMSNRVPKNHPTIEVESHKKAFKNIPLIRKVLLRLHDKIFKLYFEN